MLTINALAAADSVIIPVQAHYCIYDNGKLIDTYTTDIKGQFTTKYYTCGDN